MIEFQHRQIQISDSSTLVICRIKGSIDGSTVLEFEEKLLGFLNQGLKRLILVFSQVQYINSTGMGILVKVADKSKAEHGDFCLVEVPERIINLFNVLGLLKLIKLFKTEDEALRYFQPKKPGDANKSAAPPSKPIPPPPPPSPDEKIFAIYCKKCQKKISLGTNLIEGTYKCPLCKAMFQVLGDGQVRYLVFHTASQN